MSYRVISYKEIKQAKSIYISGNNLAFENASQTKSKVDGSLVWTENEIRLLERATDFKTTKAYDGINLECVKEKYAQILSIFVSNLSQESSGEYLKTEGRKN